MLHVPPYPWSVAFGNRFYFRYMGEAGISEASGIIDFLFFSRAPWILIFNPLQLLGSSLGDVVHSSHLDPGPIFAWAGS